MNEKRSRSWTLVAAACIVFCVVAGVVYGVLRHNENMYKQDRLPQACMDQLEHPRSPPQVSAQIVKPVVVASSLYKTRRRRRGLVPGNPELLPILESLDGN
jgi:hypothetical protein